MCLAVPLKVLEVVGDQGAVDAGGARCGVNLSLVAPVSVGQYVLVHAGFALHVLDEDEAAKTLELFEEMKSLGWEGLDA